MKERNIYLFSILLSCLLSFYLISQDDLINPDGFLYIEAAQKFISDGFSGAFAIYNWPFYSILVAIFHSLTKIPLEWSFYIFSVAFDAITVFYFIRILSFVLNDNKGVLFGALIILSAAFFNDYRELIIRGHGYWSLMASSLYYFLLAIRSGTYKEITVSLLSASVAVLFRIEGMVFAVFYFMAFVFYKMRMAESVSVSIKYLVPLFLLMIVSVLWAWLFGFSKIVQDVVFYLDFSSVISGLDYGANLVKTNFLSKYGEDYSMLFVISGLFGILLVEIVGSIGKFYVLLALLHIRQITGFYRDNKIILFLTCVSIIPLLVFVLTRYFVTTRYVFYTALLILIPLVKVVSDSFDFKMNKVKSCVVAFLIFASFVDGVVSFKKTDKTFFKDASEWAVNNVTSCGVVGTNSTILNFLINGEYAHAPRFELDSYDFPIDYLVFYSRRKSDDLEVLKGEGWFELKRFVNNRSDTIYVLGRTKSVCVQKIRK